MSEDSPGRLVHARLYGKASMTDGLLTLDTTDGEIYIPARSLLWWETNVANIYPTVWLNLRDSTTIEVTFDDAETSFRLLLILRSIDYA